MSVPDNLRSTHSEKTKNAMKAPRSVKRITFNPSEANPGETLYVHVPKLNKNEVLVPGSLALRFDIDLSGGHANNLSRPERIAGACEQDDSKVRRHNPGRNGGLRRVQDIPRPVLAWRKARQHGAGGHLERRFEQDTLRRGRCENLGS